MFCYIFKYTKYRYFYETGFGYHCVEKSLPVQRSSYLINLVNLYELVGRVELIKWFCREKDLRYLLSRIFGDLFLLSAENTT